MKKVSVFLFLALIISCLPSCGKQQSYSSSFFLMDTVVTVTLYTNDETLAERQLNACRELLAELDGLWSRQITNGELAVWNSSPNGTEYRPDARTIALLTQASGISRNTGGAFDITLAQISDLWQTCGAADRLPTSEELSALLAHTGTEKITITGNTVRKPESTKIDLGAIGKGAAISILTDTLESSGIPGGLVSFGSNVAVFGSKPDGSPFRIALRDPKDTNGTVGTFSLPAGTVLSVSGDYERFVTIGGNRYHHILDPKTGYPADTGLSSVAVICEDGALADALSTALFVMGLDAAQEFYRSGIYRFEAVFITTGGEIFTTAGMTCFSQT